MARIVLIDDEKQARNALREELMSLSLAIEIVGEAGFLQEAIQLIDTTKPDIVLLDIQLKDGTGFHVLEKVNHQKFTTIFITAYDEYAIKAFRTNAVDYLLKPINALDLKRAVEKAIDQVELLYKDKQYKKIDTSVIRKRVAFQTTEGISLFFLDEIIYCNASGNYTNIYFIDTTKLTLAKTLKEVEAIIADKGFERIHQSYLINLMHLKKYTNKDGGSVVMIDGTELPVSQRKKTHITEVLLGENHQII